MKNNILTLSAFLTLMLVTPMLRLQSAIVNSPLLTTELHWFGIPLLLVCSSLLACCGRQHDAQIILQRRQ